MKFLTKINRTYFLLIIALFIVISTVSYFVLQKVIFNEAKESLTERASETEKRIKETGELPNIFPVVETKKVIKVDKISKPFKTVLVRDELEDEYERYIEHSTIVKIKGSYYLITVRRSVLENRELLTTIVLSLLIILLLSFSLSYIWSKRITKKLWTEFEINLYNIENFSFGQQEKIRLNDTGIEEFDRLNAIIRVLTEKLRSDYYNLKEFSENASHELQTPLAIVSLNLEEVLQNRLSPSVSKKVYSAYQSVKKLSRLNQSLLLLSKIKNKQFAGSENINLTEIIKRKTNELSALAQSKNVTFELNNIDNFELNANRHLIDILLNNLLSNAVSHNVSGGFINITLQKEKLTVCNSGKPSTLDSDIIFERFTKADSESYGLGLAIVKQICDVSGIIIKYEYRNNNHCFILFPET